MSCAQAGIEHSLREELARRNVVGMTVAPVRDGDRFRLAATNQSGDRARVIVARTERAIGQSKVDAPLGSEHLARGLRLREPLLHCAVAPHLAGREIAQTDTEAHARVLRDGPAGADLEIVGMRTENEQVNGFHRCYLVNPHTASSFSAAP